MNHLVRDHTAIMSQGESSAEGQLGGCWTCGVLSITQPTDAVILQFIILTHCDASV